jgi:predicted PurR-regulated permease PerM
MLNWHRHARRKTVKLFSEENRATAHAALGEISSMMRTFIAGNFVIGVCLSLASMLLFAVLKLPYFYFLGFISGFLSMVPYLGVILAIVTPLIVGMGTLSSSGMLAIVVVLIVLHLLGMNVLYPKFIGSRAQLNPLVVTIALLVWGWMWGAIGLILAIPIASAVKIICDHVDRLHPVGEWMGE